MTVTVETSTVVPLTEPTAGQWTSLTDRLVQPLTTDLGPGNGRAEFALANDDGALDPTTARPRLMEQIRIEGDGNPMFRGFVRRWQPAWRFGQAVIEVTVTDAWEFLSLQDADLDLPRQRTHTRIGTLLDAASWPAGRRDVSDGVVTVVEYEQPSASIRRVLDDTADAEDGELWINRSGTIVFRSRHARFDADVDLTVISDDADGPGLLAPEGFDPVYDTDMLVNIGRVELADGDVWEATDSASVTKYGPRVMPVRDLPVPGYEARGLAGWVVVRYGEPQLTVSELAVLTDDDVDGVLGLGVGSLIEFRLRPQSGELLTLQGHVEQIRDQVEAGRMLTRFRLSPYFGEGPWFLWGDDEVEGSLWLTDEATTGGGKWAP